MPAKNISINLLGAEDISRTPLGRLINWTTSYGRYIMILTEVVVLLAFLARFSLDRKLTDLKEEITQKQYILEANQDFEKEIRTLQSQLKIIKTLIQTQSQPLTTFDLVLSSLPPDVFLNSYDHTQNLINIKAVAGSAEGLSQFLASMQTHKQFADLEISDVNRKGLNGITFNLIAKLNKPKPTAAPTPAVNH